MFDRISILQHDTLEGIPNPSETDFLEGHNAVRDFLSQAYISGKLPHAFLFSGAKGIGKATLAFHFIRSVLFCRENISFSFIPISSDTPLFRQIACGSHPSVLHTMRSSSSSSSSGFKTVLSLDEIRRIDQFLSMTSQEGSFRFVVVDCVDDMNRSSANALLKKLEEPPKRVVFILISHVLSYVIPTLRSRCQLVRFSPLSDEELTRVIERLGIKEGSNQVDCSMIFLHAKGSARKALLLQHSRGLDVLKRLTLLFYEKFDRKEAWNLAEIISASDCFPGLFDIFNEFLLDSLSSFAKLCVIKNQYEKAQELACLWRQIVKEAKEVKTYNLDKKQHALSVMQRIAFFLKV